MSICIGIKCNDGLVLATDTQYTSAVKSQGPKLFPLFLPTERPDLAVVIAGAGRNAFIKRAVESIEAALSLISDPSLEETRACIENSLMHFHQQHIYPIPQDRAPDVTLICGVWTRKEGYGLFTTEEGEVNYVTTSGTGYCTIGAGQAVAENALALTFQPGLSVENAKFVAAFCVKAAKDHDVYCGGNTRIYTVKEDGSGFMLHRLIETEVSEIERGGADLMEAVKVLVDGLDHEGTDEETVGLITDFVKQTILDFRTKRKESKERLAQIRARAAARRTARAAEKQG